MKCPNCHAEVGRDDNFCGDCGKTVRPASFNDLGLNEADTNQLSFVRLSDFYNYWGTRPFSPLFLGYILYAHLNLKLSAENIIEIVYPHNYFEYVYVEEDQSIIIVSGMLYSNSAVTLDALNHQSLSKVKAANFLSYPYPDIVENIKPEDLIKNYLYGNFKDCLVLHCIPFSIDIENESDKTYDTVIEEFTTIPVTTPFYVHKACDRLKCRIKFQDKVLEKTIFFNEFVGENEINLCINSDYNTYLELPSGRTINF